MEQEILKVITNEVKFAQKVRNGEESEHKNILMVLFKE